MNTKTLNNDAAEFDQNDVTQKRIISESSSVRIQKKIKKSKDAFRTISEVADKLVVQQHVLRFWETKFSQVRPLKRGGGRRYYRPEDVALLTRIHHLLYTEGYTIKGVQKMLKEQGKAGVIAAQDRAQVGAKNSAPAQSKVSDAAVSPKQISHTQRATLEIMLAELKAMRAMIKV